LARIAIVVIAGGLVLGGTQVADAAPPRPAVGIPGDAESVTLLTGDQVFPGAGGGAGYLKPAPGRERVTFSTYRSKDHGFVVPSDAMPLLAKGVLDERLFDVTALLAAGYGDASRPTLPLIVTYAGGRRPMSALSGVTTTLDLPSIGGAAVNAEKSAASALWSGLTGGVGAMAATGIEKVWLDGTRTATLDRSVPQIGAPTAWQAGYTGAGTTVAVLDTGVDQTHPDLADREVGERNFSGSADSVDHYGHGTHVASIIAGTGAKSGGKFKGVAYGARILDVKVLKDNGSGADSGIIAGMQWAAEQGADIVNMSLGGYDSPEVDPLEEAVNSLSDRYGTLFVIAAGNSGPNAGTIGSPGSADAALTVGAVDRNNKIADFSSRGPRDGGGVIKPDLTAPGVDIVAARHADGRIGPPVVDGYTSLSGTSMATPHVAGAAALLAQQYPALTGEQLKARLTASSTPTAGLSPFQQGAGRVDSAKALTQTVTSLPGSLTFGTHQWPHTGTPAVTKEVTYANGGTAPVTIDLRVEATGADGASAPAGLFTVSPGRLTVPAGGSATATVTADVRTAPAGGQFGGALVATGGAVSARAAVAVDLEPESYDLVLHGIDRAGAPARFFSAFLINVDTDARVYPSQANGTSTTRVPKGRYLLSSSVQASGEPYTHDVINYPYLTVSGPTTIDLDARLAKPISVRIPDPTASLSLLQVAFERVAGPHRYPIGNLSFGGSIAHIGTVHLGPVAPPNEVTGQLSTYWKSGSGADFYGLAWYRKGSTYTGFTKEVRKSELATVRVDVGPLQPGHTATIGHTSSPHGRLDWSWGSLDTFVPGPRTEYYGGENADWARRFNTFGPTGYQGGLVGPPKYYAPGKTYSEPFNRGVFGPAFANTRAMPWVRRTSDELVAEVPLFGDSAGNIGLSATDTATTKLYRDGVQVGATEESGYGWFPVQPGAADYRLVADSTRSNNPLSTRVSAAWTFRSDTTAATTALPISVIRYTPSLDNAGTAPSGRVFTVPVAVQTQAGVAKSSHRLIAEASYDGGTTWQAVSVLGNARLLLCHPKGAMSVSLRAKATDHHGNAVEQTIINAYLLR
jgi:subtilisin family serine protease